MFNLEQTIEAWRQQMIEAGIKAPVPLDELESHLRDALQDKINSGLPAEQAFRKALEEIGHAGDLKSEFEKLSTFSWWFRAENARWHFAIGCVIISALAGLSSWVLEPPSIRKDEAIGQFIVFLGTGFLMYWIGRAIILRWKVKLTKAQIALGESPRSIRDRLENAFALKPTNGKKRPLWLSMAIGVLLAALGALWSFLTDASDNRVREPMFMFFLLVMNSFIMHSINASRRAKSSQPAQAGN